MKINLNKINMRTTQYRNFTVLYIGTTTLYFSYETIIGFRTPETGLCVTENVWGCTTGKHLNAISEKKDRIPREEFLKLLEDTILI